MTAWIALWLSTGGVHWIHEWVRYPVNPYTRSKPPGVDDRGTPDDDEEEEEEEDEEEDDEGEDVMTACLKPSSQSLPLPLLPPTPPIPPLPPLTVKSS